MSLDPYQKQSTFGGSQTLLDERAHYDANGNLDFQGFAITGTPTSTAAWLIIKNTYDGSNNWTSGSIYRGKTWDSVPF
jgi:hypothetical protein